MSQDYNDYPFDECAEAARKYHVEKGATIFQKWTCQHCGSRQTMEEANRFFTRGICEECGKETDIQARGCNYLMVL